MYSLHSERMRLILHWSICFFLLGWRSIFVSQFPHIQLLQLVQLCVFSAQQSKTRGKSKFMAMEQSLNVRSLLVECSIPTN